MASKIAALQVRLEARGFFGKARTHFRSPAKFFQERIRFALHHVRGDFAKQWREFESVTTIAGCNNQSLSLRIGRDPKISVISIAVQTNPCVNDRCINQSRNCPRQELSQIAFFLGYNYPIGRIRRHLAAGSVIGHFHHALVERETVISGSRNIGAEKGKMSRREKLGVVRFEMKYRMSRRAKKFSGEWQHVGSPGADCDNYCVTANSLSTLQDNAFDAGVIFV